MADVPEPAQPPMAPSPVNKSAAEVAEDHAELDLPPFLAAPKLTSLKSQVVVKHWASPRSEEDILPEYRAAFKMCCLHPRLMVRWGFGNYANVDAHSVKPALATNTVAIATTTIYHAMALSLPL